MHTVHHRTIDCRVHLKIPGMFAMIPAATVILVTRSSSVSTTVSYTSYFMCPQRKKSRHVRSGDLGGQAKGLPRPIHRFPKVALGDTDIRIFGVVEPIAVDTLSLQLVHFHSQSLKPDARQPYQHAVVVGFNDTFLTPKVTSVASDIEREKSDKFCSEALISA